jgi:hypothetical protein
LSVDMKSVGEMAAKRFGSKFGVSVRSAGAIGQPALRRERFGPTGDSRTKSGRECGVNLRGGVRNSSVSVASERKRSTSVGVEKVTSEMGRSRGEAIGSTGVCMKPIESLGGPVLGCVGISAKDAADRSGSRLEDLPSRSNRRPIALSIYNQARPAMTQISARGRV